MNPGLWLRFAARDLRSGLQGFWIFLTCLALGTGTIAIIGALAAAIERGIDEQGQPLLGGDLEFSLIHQQATEPQLAFIASKGALSKVATVRGMVLTDESTALVEVKEKSGTSLILVTHDRALAQRCDRMAEVLDGKIVSGCTA